MAEFQVRPLVDGDKGWVTDMLIAHVGSTKIVSRGKVYRADRLPGFVAEREGKTIGLTTFNIENDDCEIISLESLAEGEGVGSALIEAVKDVAVAEKCRRLWLITTNDNMKAVRFYQKKGFELVAVHRNALEESRRMKPEIPLIGMDDIALRDEIELEIPLQDK